MPESQAVEEEVSPKETVTKTEPKLEREPEPGQKSESESESERNKGSGRERSKNGLFHKIVNYFKIDLDTFIEEEEEFPEELDTYKQQSTKPRSM